MIKSVVTSKRLKTALKCFDANNPKNSEGIAWLKEFISELSHEEKKRKDQLHFFSRKKFKKPQNMLVDVSRIGYAGKTIVIRDALSQRDGAEKALDLAGNFSFSEHTANYEVESTQIATDELATHFSK